MGMGNVPNLQKNLFLLPPMTCPIIAVGNSLSMGLLVENMETCYSSATLTVLPLGTAPSLLTALLGLFPAPLAGTEWLLLVATCYEQYLALCHPLLSARLRNWKGCR